MARLELIGFGSVLGLVVAALASVGVAFAGDAPSGWQLADRSGKGEDALALFVEAKPTPGRPAFRLETSFAVPPAVAREILVEGMLDEKLAPSGQRRKILERGATGTVVYTFIDLPIILSDRELAIRVVESEDPATGVQRIEWNEANDVLPPVDADVVRLDGASGFWEFRPNGHGGTQAIHETRTELGGSFPAALGDRLMKNQAVDSVESLRARIDARVASDVAAGPRP